MVIAAAALLAGLVDGALVLSSDHFTDREWALFGPLIGWSFIGTGRYASRRRPESQFGVLMVVLGFTWFLAPLEAADSALLFTLGILLGSIWGAVLAHVLLSFPSGRLAPGPQRALVIAGYVLVPLAPVPAMLVSESDALADCGGRVSAEPAADRERRAAERGPAGGRHGRGDDAVPAGRRLPGGALAGRRPVGATQPRPALGAGALTLLLVFAYAATEVPALRTLAFVVFAATPFAFLAGLARADLSQPAGCAAWWPGSADLPGHGDLRGALAAAVGDPTLSLAFWVPEQDRYVDEQGAVRHAAGHGR